MPPTADPPQSNRQQHQSGELHLQRRAKRSDSAGRKTREKIRRCPRTGPSASQEEFPWRTTKSCRPSRLQAAFSYFQAKLRHHFLKSFQTSAFAADCAANRRGDTWPSILRPRNSCHWPRKCEMPARRLQQRLRGARAEAHDHLRGNRHQADASKTANMF